MPTEHTRQQALLLKSKVERLDGFLDWMRDEFPRIVAANHTEDIYREFVKPYADDMRENIEEVFSDLAENFITEEQFLNEMPDTDVDGDDLFLTNEELHDSTTLLEIQDNASQE